MSISAEVLRKCGFFSKLEDDDLQRVFEQTKHIELKNGDFLFQEGELKDALFILVHGKLLVSTKDKDIHEIIGFIRPGDVVGELALFTNEPRSASIQAVQDSLVLCYEKEAFQELCYKNPQLLWEVTSSIASRARENVHQAHHSQQGLKHRIIAFLIVSTQIKSVELLNELEKCKLEKYKINFIQDIASIDPAEWADEFKKAQEHQSIVFFSLDIQDLNSKGQLLSFADKIVIVLQDSVEDLTLASRILHEQIEKHVPHTEKELLLLHKEIKTVYPNTQTYLRLTHFSKHYHLCMQSPLMCRRLLRRLSGHATGVVISGGGAKGWAAVGAMLALYEHDAEIDYVGGTSAGAGITACYATSRNKEEFLKALSPFEKNLISWKNITLPLVSLFKGKQETNIAKKLYGQTMIEDLAMPFFCVSANLSSYCEHIWENGYLWQAIRASTGVPSLVPPVVLNGQLHVDGGIINDFPVDIMFNKLDHRGFVIGIETIENNLDHQKYNFSPSMGILEALEIKFDFIRPRVKYLGIVEILERVVSIGSIVKAMQNARRADLNIKPDLQGFKFTDFPKKDAMLAIGYEEAKKQLKSTPIPK